jgi:hypothetical protein
VIIISSKTKVAKLLEVPVKVKELRLSKNITKHGIVTTTTYLLSIKTQLLNN